MKNIDYEKEVIELIKKLIAIPSINPPGNENKACELVYEYMHSNGFETTKVEVEENRYDVIARLPGKSSKDALIFTGHMDVVPISHDERKKWKTDPFDPVEKDGYIYGRGSADMKSGLACAMVAMKMIKETTIPPTDIFLVATVDEEDFMKGSKAITDHPLLKECTQVIVCEPTNLECCTGSRGRTYGEINIVGKTGHGSQQGVGNNAILIANRIIDKMMEVEFQETPYGKTFWQPLAINAGVEPCVVPDKCYMKIDSRIAIGNTPDQVWRLMEDILEQTHKEIEGFKHTINIIDKREPWLLENSPLIEKIKKASEKIGMEHKQNIFMGTTDGTILKRQNRQVIIIGPGNLNTVHKENENIQTNQITTALALYAASGSGFKKFK